MKLKTGQSFIRDLSAQLFGQTDASAQRTDGPRRDEPMKFRKSSNRERNWQIPWISTANRFSAGIGNRLSSIKTVFNYHFNFSSAFAF